MTLGKKKCYKNATLCEKSKKVSKIISLLYSSAALGSIPMALATSLLNSVGFSLCGSEETHQYVQLTIKQFLHFFNVRLLAEAERNPINPC